MASTLTCAYEPCHNLFVRTTAQRYCCPQCRIDDRKCRRCRKPIGMLGSTLRSYCLPCDAELARLRRLDPSERIKAVSRHRFKQFGITLDDYLAMSEAQNHLCKVCGEPETAKTNRRHEMKTLSVDHSHETGKVRGLLCTRCNTALGLLRDDPDLIRRAARYLERFQEAHQASLIGDA